MSNKMLFKVNLKVLRSPKNEFMEACVNLDSTSDTCSTSFGSIVESMSVSANPTWLTNGWLLQGVPRGTTPINR